MMMWLSIGVLSDLSELFTNKEVYTETENVTLTFVNRGLFPANSGYCFEISYREQKNGPSTSYGLPCIEILVVVPVGGNITWVLTTYEMKGPGYYTVSYSIYRGEQLETLQTKFVIVDSPLNRGYFVPGFGALTSIMTILAMLLLRPRKRV